MGDGGERASISILRAKIKNATHHKDDAQNRATVPRCLRFPCDSCREVAPLQRARSKLKVDEGARCARPEEEEHHRERGIHTRKHAHAHPVHSLVQASREVTERVQQEKGAHQHRNQKRRFGAEHATHVR